jgi:hypothetical protein
MKTQRLGSGNTNNCAKILGQFWAQDANKLSNPERASPACSMYNPAQ